MFCETKHTRLYSNACNEDDMAGKKKGLNQENQKTVETQTPAYGTRPLCIRATYSRRKDKSEAGYIRWSDRRQCAIKGMKTDDLLVIQITVSSQHLTLELFLVIVPQLGGLGVQWARTIAMLA